MKTNRSSRRFIERTPSEMSIWPSSRLMSNGIVIDRSPSSLSSSRGVHSGESARESEILRTKTAISSFLRPLQRRLLDRQLAHADAGRGEDRVGDRGRQRRHARFAEPAERRVGADERRRDRPAHRRCGSSGSRGSSSPRPGPARW